MRGSRPVLGAIETNGEEGGITPGAAGTGYWGLKFGQWTTGFP